MLIYGIRNVNILTPLTLDKNPDLKFKHMNLNT